MEDRIWKIYEELLSKSLKKINSELGKKNSKLKEIISKCESSQISNFFEKTTSIMFLAMIHQDKNEELNANKYYPIFKQVIETKIPKLMELSIFTLQVSF